MLVWGSKIQRKTSNLRETVTPSKFLINTKQIGGGRLAPPPHVVFFVLAHYHREIFFFYFLKDFLLFFSFIGYGSGRKKLYF